MDQMLSKDSCVLVEEHLEHCEACREFEKELKSEADSLEFIGDRKNVEVEAKAALQGIRRSIVRKRILSVCVAVALVLSAVRVGYYFYAEKQSYISYENSGLVMQGDKLYATKTYYGRLSSIVSPDQTVQFLRMQETAEVKKVYPSETCNELITDYGNQIDPEQRTIEDEDKISGIEKVYYLPEEYVNYRFNYDDPEIGAAQTKELEEKSILLWEKSNDE
jgi:hypothetical protein